ncbi:uncharacterized protein LOC125516687 [Triticum urartu]|uniref:uncharacterized protein LOC125516686 n=1 Tax=Triticum urartu TaxID=4572 RepID=UPI002043F1BB|nr:uncharacterized protein LOC125516686 [Triticum urartu]XP_048537992.1 uncharacterized protein LOC125516687 [Triticum urartu]
MQLIAHFTPHVRKRGSSDLDLLHLSNDTPAPKGAAAAAGEREEPPLPGHRCPRTRIHTFAAALALADPWNAADPRRAAAAEERDEAPPSLRTWARVPYAAAGVTPPHHSSAGATQPPPPSPRTRTHSPNSLSAAPSRSRPVDSDGAHHTPPVLASRRCVHPSGWIRRSPVARASVASNSGFLAVHLRCLPSPHAQLCLLDEFVLLEDDRFFLNLQGRPPSSSFPPCDAMEMKLPSTREFKGMWEREEVHGEDALLQPSLPPTTRCLFCV